MALTILTAFGIDFDSQTAFFANFVLEPNYLPNVEVSPSNFGVLNDDTPARVYLRVLNMAVFQDYLVAICR